MTQADMARRIAYLERVVDVLARSAGIDPELDIYERESALDAAAKGDQAPLRAWQKKRIEGGSRAAQIHHG